jgi:hypothetical protein
MYLIHKHYGDLDPDYELPVLPTNVLLFSSLPQTPPEALARLCDSIYKRNKELEKENEALRAELAEIKSQSKTASWLQSVMPSTLARLDEDRGITPYERHVVIKDQLNNNHTQPIDRLPAAVADAINAAID